jgi:ABC-2 type transport system ATP-binding protein
MDAIRVENISKSFNETHAVKKVSFNVPKGELFGLIGPDGAGKTTLFQMLTSLLLPDSGTIEIEKFNTVKEYKEIRKIIGYMPGKFSLYQDLTVEENLNFFATIFGTSIKENYHIIEEIYSQLKPFKNRRAGKLSGGMKQKLALSCALIHEPKVLFLDEPTTGVDAVSRSEFWEMLKRLKSRGITIMVSTPYMDEASLCERIGLIQNGAIMKIDSPQNIIKSYSKPIFAARSYNNYSLLKQLRGMDSVLRAEPFGDSIHLTVNNADDIVTIKNAVTQGEPKEISIEAIEPSIEDVFLDLM